MNHPEHLSRNELDQLAQAYLDCRLTLLEEKELEFLLLSTDVSSPLIDEARMQMTLTSLIANSHPRNSARPPVRLLRYFHIAGAAACIAAIVLTLGLWLRTPSPSESFYVCIDGRELPEAESRIKAAEIEAATMVTFDRLLAEARRESDQSRQIIENLNRN